MHNTTHNARFLTSVLLVSLPLFVGCAPLEAGDYAADQDADDAGLEAKGKTNKPPKGGTKPPKGGTTGGGTTGGTTAGGTTGGTTGGGTTGGTTGGGTTGGTTGGGTTGGTTGGVKAAWCIGEDTDQTPERSAPAGYCDICGGREFKSANWQTGKGCLERYQQVTGKDTASLQCQAFITDMRSYCCDGFYVHPVRTQCAHKGPYQPVDLCADGCFPSNAATAGTYLLNAGGPLAPFVRGLGDRRGTCYQDDVSASGGFTWTCRRAYYLLKYGHLPTQAANEVISWWRGSGSYGANCGCDAKNTKNPAYSN